MTINPPFETGAQAVARWARTTPAAIAVFEGEAAWSYATFVSHIARAAEMLRSAGLRRGMVFGIHCDQHYLHLVLIFACEILGAAHLSMTPADAVSDGEVAGRCDLLGADAVTEVIAKHPRAIALSRHSIAELEAIRPENDTVAMIEAVPPPDEIVRIATTSGTTGRRKFVGHSRRALEHMAASIQFTLNDDADNLNYVSVYRFNQWGSYIKPLLALRSGKSIFYCNETDFLPTVRRLPACHTMLLVSDAFHFAQEASRDGQRADCCSLRIIGAALTPRLRAELRASITNHLVSAYASNEAGNVCLMDDSETGTVYPDVSIRIVDEAGRERNLGEPGIIMVRSPCLSAGYLWNDDETERHFADGWFRTSDIGVIPQPGKLILLGRSDDMLNIGGIKVAPYPIEERIKSIDGVTDAVLIGHVNRNGADELHLFVECRDREGFRPIGALIDLILSQHVPPITPHYGTGLPRTETGKVRRTELRNHIEQAARQTGRSY